MSHDVVLQHVLAGRWSCKREILGVGSKSVCTSIIPAGDTLKSTSAGLGAVRLGATFGGGDPAAVVRDGTLVEAAVKPMRFRSSALPAAKNRECKMKKTF